MSLGSNIKKRRFELKLSQQELATLMGYKSRSTIAKIEAGENDVTQAKLQKFAQVLDTSIESLISGTEGSENFSSQISLRDPATTEKNGVRNVAIILAGGKSVRNHQNVPNQFINILGKPVIVYCLEAYQNHPAIDDIYIVCLKGWENIVLAYAKQFQITKLRGLIPGGDSGIQSIVNAMSIINNFYSAKDVIIFQESTRPMVTVDLISKLLQSCYINESATVCQSMKDYVHFSINNGNATYLDRNAIVDLQSPEAHTCSRLNAIFKRAKKRQHSLNESCLTLLMYNIGFDINFIEGSINNIKIVRQEDIAIATALLKQQQ